MPSMHHNRVWEQRATSQPQTGQGRRKSGEGTLPSSFVLFCMPNSVWLFHFFICSLCRLSPALECQLLRGKHAASLDIPAAPAHGSEPRADNSTAQALAEDVR